MINPKKLLLVLTATLLVACEPSPVFETSKEFIPPNSEAGLACLGEISEQREVCNKQHKSELEGCKSEAEKEARIEMSEREKEYIESFDSYSKALEIYHIHKADYEKKHSKINKLYKKYKKKCPGDEFGSSELLVREACEREEDLFIRLEELESDKPQKPEPPEKPDIKTITEEKSIFCDQDNMCKKNYELSFSSCGGKIILHKKCIKHCD